VHAEDPVEKMKAAPNHPQKVNGLILQLPTVAPSTTRL